MKNLISFTLVVSILNPLFALQAHADRWNESVKTSAGKYSTSTGSDLTSQDTKNGAAKSPFKACENVMLVTPEKAKGGRSSSASKQSDYWDARAKACDAATSNCTMKVVMMTDAAKAPVVNAFLEDVKQRTSGDLDKGIAKYETTKKTCFGGSKDASCAATISDMQKRIDASLPKLRKSVAMLGVPNDKDLETFQVKNDYSILINKELSATRAFVQAPKMKELTSSEYDAVKTELEGVVAKARKEWNEENEKLLAPLKVKGREDDLKKQEAQLRAAGQFTVKLKEALAKHRTETLKKYMAAVESAPESVYVGEAKASEAALAAGLTAMIADGRESSGRLKKITKEKSSAGIDSNLVGLIAYDRTVNTMIEESIAKTGSTAMCATATAAYNALKDKEFANGMIATGVIVGASVGAAIAAPFLPGAGVGGAAAAAGSMSAAAGTFAITSGIIGGLAMTTHEVIKAGEMRQDARAGLTSYEEAQKATDGAALGIVASPLDFVGGGAVLAGGAIAVKKGAQKVVGSTLSRFSTNAVSKGAVQVAGTTAAETAQLAATAVAAAAKTGAAVAGSTATKEAVAAAATKLGQIGEKGSEALLGRAATKSDEVAFDSMAKAGFLGTEKAPSFDVAKTYASITQKMPEAARVEYAAKVKQISEVVAEGKAAAKAAKADPVRDEAVAKAALEMADIAPDVKEAAKILRPDSGYNTEAVNGVREVWRAAKALAAGAAAKVKDSVETRVRKVLAKFTGKSADSPEVTQLCRCMPACAVARASNDPFDLESLAAPKYVACVNH